jgi:formylglycine-generating enzyme required for sulfatase activity
MTVRRKWLWVCLPLFMLGLGSCARRSAPPREPEARAPYDRGTEGASAPAASLTSHVGNAGPRLGVGTTPSSLGWGADDRAHPDRFAVNPVDLSEMVWVPAATFQMGSTQEEMDRQWSENRWVPAWRSLEKGERPPHTISRWAAKAREFNQDERPVHQVTLTRGFWLGRREVATEQYQHYLDATGRDPAVDEWPSFAERERLPAVWVMWRDAKAYAAWAGCCLPTEAQWEWSARGPERRIYPWGDTWDRAKCNSAEYWAGKALRGDALWEA